MKHAMTQLAAVGFTCCLLTAAGVPEAKAADTFAKAPDTPAIKTGSNVTIKLTIEVPEDRLMFPERVSEYTHGRQQLIPALEEALAGKHAGDQAHLDLDADHAFGPYDETKIVTVSRQELPSDAKVGDAAKTQEGIPFTVLEVNDREALLDFNHPLAGKRIVLNVMVLRVIPQS